MRHQRLLPDLGDVKPLSQQKEADMQGQGHRHQPSEGDVVGSQPAIIKGQGQEV